MILPAVQGNEVKNKNNFFFWNPDLAGLMMAIKSFHILLFYTDWSLDIGHEFILKSLKLGLT